MTDSMVVRGDTAPVARRQPRNPDAETERYVPTTKVEALQSVDLKSSAGWFTLVAGLILLPDVSDFFGRLLDLPNQVMANGYGCIVKKGDFELKFGKDLFSYGRGESKRQNGQKP